MFDDDLQYAELLRPLTGVLTNVTFIEKFRSLADHGAVTR